MTAKERGIFNPFFRLKNRLTGVYSVVNEIFKILKSPTTSLSRDHSLNEIYFDYLSYDLFFVMIKDNPYKFMVPAYDNSFKLRILKLRHIKGFKAFFDDLHSGIDTIEHFRFYYKKRKITSIVCNIYIHKTYSNHHSASNVDIIEMNITFDNEFNVTSIDRRYKYEREVYNGDYLSTDLFLDHIVENQIILDDELFLMMLALEPVGSKKIEMFPEYTIPSAYDFSSDEFRQRMLLCDMIHC